MLVLKNKKKKIMERQLLIYIDFKENGDLDTTWAKGVYRRSRLKPLVLSKDNALAYIWYHEYRF